MKIQLFFVTIMKWFIRERYVQMSGEKRRVKVTINDKEYTIIGTKSAAHVELVASTINKQLARLNTMSTDLSKEEQATLIAVNAVSDQIESHKRMIELEEELEALKNNKTE